MRGGTGIFIILFSGLLSVYAQDSGKDSLKAQPYLEILYHSGTFWSRTENLQEQFDQGYRAFEARIGFQTKGRRAWHQLHKFPKYGLGLHYADLVKTRKDTIVGNPFSLFVFYSAPWLRYGRFTLNTDLSVGLSYTSLIYHPERNPVNDVVASHMNLYFGFNFRLYMEISRRMHMNVGAGLTHHSNGRIHVPQKGINSWGWSAGLNYILSKAVDTYYYRELPRFQPYEELQIMAAAGTVEAIPEGDTEELRYCNFSITGDYAINFNPKMAMTLGLDVLYDGSLERAIKGMLPEEVSTYQKMYLGSHLGYQYTIHRLTLMFNLGTYFRQSSYDRGFWFGRAGGRFRLTDQVYAHLAIKTRNGIRSDWIEWGAAYYVKIR
ncbi:MAG: acyloxyacyl hydrolase [Bacteroidota bacterium]